ncbi:glycosyltransferase family 2 protein [Candidatus Uhrbacteria bacterium]|nr:glycosyltransferase family 2 protein [Candidatus Uhrbacteria bacterium]
MNNGSTSPFVDVIVVLWHSRPYLPALFDGLAGLAYPRDRMAVHVVDNSPGDGSLDEVRRLMAVHGERLPSVILHEPGKNTGFSGGNNLAMRQAIESGHPYVYLLNHDASFEPDALAAAVEAAERDPGVGSAQSLLVLQQHPDEVNSVGNAIHFLGFGYCAGYHEKRADVGQDIREIAYASGAGVLYPTRVLKEVGLFDDTLFAYHEDLDLGWRIRLAGYKNVLAPRSVVRHRYEFSRSIAKWFWMERNRSAVVLKNYRWPTLVFLAPQLLAVDIIILMFSVMGGWWREKLRAMVWFWKPSTWVYLMRGRKEVERIRRVPDATILKRWSPEIAYQEFEHPFMTTVANPLMGLSFRILKFVVRW